MYVYSFSYVLGFFFFFTLCFIIWLFLFPTLYLESFILYIAYIT